MGRRGILPQLSSCGPIEAQSWFSASPPTSSLPQLSSCGPIEAIVGGGARRRRQGPFRNCQVAAPLKPIRGRNDFQGSGAFRNCQVAAPLKLISRPIVRIGMRGLPQLSSCGPIEAIRNGLPCRLCGPLPQLSSCGPIEATSRDSARRSAPAPSATVKLRPH